MIGSRLIDRSKLIMLTALRSQLDRLAREPAKIVVRVPSAKRADHVSIGTSSRRPIDLIDWTCAPSVSTWEAIARASAPPPPGRTPRTAPRRVRSYSIPIRSTSLQTYHTKLSVHPVGLGVSWSA